MEECQLHERRNCDECPQFKNYKIGNNFHYQVERNTLWIPDELNKNIMPPNKFFYFSNHNIAIEIRYYGYGVWIMKVWKCDFVKKDICIIRINDLLKNLNIKNIKSKLTDDAWYTMFEDHEVQEILDTLGRYEIQKKMERNICKKKCCCIQNSKSLSPMDMEDIYS